MENIIHLLPESVANQIAAGEVIQRPASVVKELVENAIDAGATQIEVYLKDAGKTLIRISDNGSGMSPADAKCCFERHATSKINQANDLFHLKTMGFRGEALASIASVAQVELITQRTVDEFAWKIEIAGSQVTNEEPVISSVGTKIYVRNLFFNIPARRKFLGDNTKELKAIRDTFFQIALVYPELQLSLIHNEETLFQLQPGSLKQRILHIFGKRSGGMLHKQLYPVEVETQLIRIKGFVGDPASACLRDYMQYFFVNDRFIKHKLFRSAVLKAYDLLVPQGQNPTYFLYFEVNPEALDVNIHPTKTEVKFEHEQAIWPIIHATVREALGKANAVPSIDFDRDDAPEIRVFTGERDVASPSVQYNSGYNPFQSSNQKSTRVPTNWEDLLNGFEKKSETSNHGDTFSETFGADRLKSDDFQYSNEAINQSSLFEDLNSLPSDFLPKAIGSFSLGYILASTPSNLYVIDQQRAHQKLMYEHFLSHQGGASLSQKLLYQEVLELDPVQQSCLKEIEGTIHALGFGLTFVDGQYNLDAIPSELKVESSKKFFYEVLDSILQTGLSPIQDLRSSLSWMLAKSVSISRESVLNLEQISDMVTKLFQLEGHGLTPDGKRVWKIIAASDLCKGL